MKVGKIKKHEITWIETLDEFPKYLIIYSSKKCGITRVYQRMEESE